MLRHLFTRLIAIGAFGSLLTLSPPAAHAIPAAGDYVFTSLFSGSFTSTGSSLSAWQFTTPSGHSFSSITDLVHLNDDYTLEVYDSTFIIPGVPFAQITWDSTGFGDSFVQYYVNSSPFIESSYGLTFIPAPSSSVPEPSAGLLLLAGLVMLMGYGWRQQRQAEMQVG